MNNTSIFVFIFIFFFFYLLYAILFWFLNILGSRRRASSFTLGKGKNLILHNSIFLPNSSNININLNNSDTNLTNNTNIESADGSKNYNITNIQSTIGSQSNSTSSSSSNNSGKNNNENNISSDISVTNDNSIVNSIVNPSKSSKKQQTDEKSSASPPHEAPTSTSATETPTSHRSPLSSTFGISGIFGPKSPTLDGIVTVSKQLKGFNLNRGINGRGPSPMSKNMNGNASIGNRYPKISNSNTTPLPNTYRSATASPIAISGSSSKRIGNYTSYTSRNHHNNDESRSRSDSNTSNNHNNNSTTATVNVGHIINNGNSHTNSHSGSYQSSIYETGHTRQGYYASGK